MAAEHATTEWDQLPLALQQCILVLTGSPCARRVSKAWRDAFDATNDKLFLSLVSEQLLKPATAAATRVVKKSASLTAVNVVEQEYGYHTFPPLMLSDLLAAGAASGLATRLRKLTGIAVDAACAAQQLQALRQCTSLTHVYIRGRDLQVYLKQHGQQAALELTAALQGLHLLTRLRVCDIRGDSVVVPLASAMQPLTQLQHLDLARSDMGCASLAALVPALSAMPALQTLVVSGNYPDQEETAGWAEALCALLSAVPGLTHLDVGSSRLQEEGAAVLAPVLRGMTCLQHFNLSYNHVGGMGVAALAPALAALPNLHTLDLSGCDLQNGFVPLLQPLLSEAGSPLRKLALCQTIFSLEDAQALAAGLSTAPQLQELSLQHIGFRGDQEKGWMALAPGLSPLGPSLQLLSLAGYGQCNLSAATSTALAAALQRLTGLTRLEATHFSTPMPIVAISPALMGMQRLQVLNLYGNNLGAEGTAAFAEALARLSGSLMHLTLSTCSIDARAAASALAPALAQATALVELRLKFNAFGPLGGQWLPPVLTALPHLRKVDLRLCGLEAQGCMAVAGALQERDGVVVRLSNNGVTRGSAEDTALRNTPGICVIV